MPTVVEYSAPYRVQLVDSPTEPLPPGHLRVRTWYSGISAGTELTAYRGTNPYLTRNWDPDRRLFLDGPPTFAYPVSGWGYSEVGEVLEVADGVTEVRPGQVIAGVWGHRSEGVVAADALSWLVLPEGLAPLDGIFARVGAIALNAVLAAEARLGEKCAIFGQGVIGLLATQLGRLSGVDVLAVDAMEHRLALAASFGARHTIPAGVEGGAGARVRDLTRDSGADSAIELSGSYQALHEAIRGVGLAGRVIASGFYQGEGAGLRLGEEFHHNRVEIQCSQIGGTPLALGPRWNHRRLTTTFLHEVAVGRLTVAPLVSDVLDAQDVQRAFEMLDAGAPETLQVVLRFPAAP
ncbi:MAG TPA: zinc-binding alcohol dehydrogenase [Nocardioidaceae bacterium]|nr:zinc-binding alcohol dehydrogenase [Nocardioidaceae bacterium]